MKMRKIPMRTCVVTREKCEKKDLLRVVRDNNGNVFVDDTNKANGRGAYLKKDKDVILKAKDSKVLERHLEVKIPESIYDELISKTAYISLEFSAVCFEIFILIFLSTLSVNLYLYIILPSLFIKPTSFSFLYKNISS